MISDTKLIYMFVVPETESSRKYPAFPDSCDIISGQIVLQTGLC